MRSTCYGRSIELFQELGNRYYEAANDVDAARARWRQALGILEQLDHPDAEQVRSRITAPR